MGKSSPYETPDKNNTSNDMKMNIFITVLTIVCTIEFKNELNLFSSVQPNNSWKTRISETYTQYF